MSLASEINANAKEKAKSKVVVKVGMLGDSQIGKTTLMVKYIENRFDEDYIETLGVNFMEKVIHLKNVDVTVSVWDLGGQKEFATLMPLVCSDAKVVLFAFDLTSRQSLFAVKRWFKEARKENKLFMPFLIGTKFDLFEKQPGAFKIEMTRQARKFAKKMRAPLIYCSSSKSINVKKIFKVIIAKVFNLQTKIPESRDETSEAILEYTGIGSAGDDSKAAEDGDGTGGADDSGKLAPPSNGDDESANESGEDGKDDDSDRASHRSGKSRRDKKRKKRKKSRDKDGDDSGDDDLNDEDGGGHKSRKKGKHRDETPEERAARKKRKKERKKEKKERKEKKAKKKRRKTTTTTDSTRDVLYGSDNPDDSD